MSDVEEIVRARNNLEEVHQGQGGIWNSFKGDVCARCVAHYIQTHLSSKLKVVGPNVYLDGFPTEFDLLIVSEGATARQFTAAYPPTLAVAGIEVKASGVMGGRKGLQLQKTLGRIKNNFDAIRARFPHVAFAYITIREVSQPRREGSINYLEETKRVLAPYQVFCLQDVRTKEIFEEQWDQFMHFLKEAATTSEKRFSE